MQKMQAVYNGIRNALGLDRDDVPPTGEIGGACEHVCRLLGINPYEDHQEGANVAQEAKQVAETPKAPAPARAVGRQSVALDPSE
jgi:hypothetical protein